MSRLETWIEEEVATMRRYEPRLSAEREEEYREALAKTLTAAQLRVADEAEKLFDAAFGDRLLASLKRRSDAARDRGLRGFVRRFL